VSWQDLNWPPPEYKSRSITHIPIFGYLFERLETTTAAEVTQIFLGSQPTQLVKTGRYLERDSAETYQFLSN
jgi:hypothetical protein